MASAAPLLIVSALILSFGGRAGAQTWNGSVSDLWGTAGNWTPNTVPNSSTASVIITSATNNPLLINISPTIAGLTVRTGDSLTLNNANDLTIVAATTPSGVGTTVSNAGTITVGSPGSTTELILSGSGGFVTLTGGGTISLSNSTANVITGSTASPNTETLVNTNNTIQGAG